MVKINGERLDVGEMSVLDFLKKDGKNPQRVAVMINGEILPKDSYDRVINDGDEVDILGFVGGG
ncbi:MAG: sulfur carrier protein ThiS [Ruminococcus sp.]|nr:sulfur carrier protein ThiS [Ruminococcus sp.]